MKQDGGGVRVAASRAASHRADVGRRISLGAVGSPIYVASFLPLENGTLEFGGGRDLEEAIRADLTNTTCDIPSEAFPGLPSWHAHEATLASF